MEPMHRIACSTVICPPSGSTADILERWTRICHGITRKMAIDSRFDPQQQQHLLSLCGTAGEVSCTELSYPRRGPLGRPAPSVASSDPDEQREARAQLGATLERAHGHGVHRVLLPPTRLELPQSPAALALQFATASPLGIDTWREQREQRLPASLDALCLVLDRVLRQAEDLAIELILLTPAPWPQLFPGSQEVEQLKQVFGGAPLELRHCTDWAHAAQQLGWIDSPHPLIGCSSIRLADASGLAVQLPLGCGEVAWQDMGDLLQVEGDRVLTFRPDTSTAEMQAARLLLERLLQGQPVTDADLLQQGPGGGF